MKTSVYFLTVLAVTTAPTASAHCDSLSGPVISDARIALAKGEPDTVLKWVRTDDEAEIRQAFDNALAVRSLSPAAEALADRWFFETIVRVHRAGEGAPYTGLKNGESPELAIAAADRALATGEISPLLESAAHRVMEGLRVRFRRARDLAAHKDRSIEDGRAYVEAYVDFIHFAEATNAPAAPYSTDGISNRHND